MRIEQETRNFYVGNLRQAEQKTPEEMGFTKVSITDVGLNYQSYSGNTAGGTYSGDSLNNKYLDVDLTMPAKRGRLSRLVTKNRKGRSRVK